MSSGLKANNGEEWRTFGQYLGILEETVSVTYVNLYEVSTDQAQTVAQKSKKSKGKKAPKIDLEKLKNAMNICIKEVFNAHYLTVDSITLATPTSNGSITYSNKAGSFTIQTGVNFNVAQLNQVFPTGVLAGGITPGTTSGTKTAFGHTIAVDGRRYNYIGNDLAGGYYDPNTKLDDVIGMMASTQIHENGHSLFSSIYPLSNADGSGANQEDYGEKFTNCVYRNYK